MKCDSLSLVLCRRSSAVTSTHLREGEWEIVRRSRFGKSNLPLPGRSSLPQSGIFWSAGHTVTGVPEYNVIVSHWQKSYVSWSRRWDALPDAIHTFDILRSKILQLFTFEGFLPFDALRCYSRVADMLFLTNRSSLPKFGILILLKTRWTLRQGRYSGRCWWKVDQLIQWGSFKVLCLLVTRHPGWRHPLMFSSREMWWERSDHVSGSEMDWESECRLSQTLLKEMKWQRCHFRTHQERERRERKREREIWFRISEWMVNSHIDHIFPTQRNFWKIANWIVESSIQIIFHSNFLSDTCRACKIIPTTRSPCNSGVDWYLSGVLTVYYVGEHSHSLPLFFSRISKYQLMTLFQFDFFSRN